MTSKCTTAKSSTRKAPSRHVSTCIAAKTMPPVTAPQAPPPASDNEETINIDADLGAVTEEEDSDNPHTGLPSGGPVSKKAAPSVPSGQGRTAYDVRYFFIFLTRSRCDGSQLSDFFLISLIKHVISASK
jgi:hypothetical protein